MKRTKAGARRSLESKMSAPHGFREALFLEVYPFSRRAAQVRSWAATARHADLEREDLEQEALLNVWAALERFDVTRASLRTFGENVVATCLASVVRRARAAKRTKAADYQQPTESFRLLVSVELRIDIQRALRKLGPQDQKVARLLVDYGPTQIARRLKISRPGVYRSINRIRAALQESGFGR
jgi:RNA polymerase sigma factor (sigma-70 family)